MMVILMIIKNVEGGKKREEDMKKIMVITKR
jgi:hypothetical protein